MLTRHSRSTSLYLVISSLLCTMFLTDSAAGQTVSPGREYRIAARYAPEFRQVVDRRKPHIDYLARYDFDGNWRADDNWKNVTDPKVSLPAYVYYAVAETPTHFFIHYVVFHPRDWKGNWFVNGGLQVVKFAGRALVLPRFFKLEAASVAHENDLEGVLVIVRRRNPDSLEGHTVMVESFCHYRFRTYLPRGESPEFATRAKRSLMEVQGNRPALFIESRGHGIRNYLKLKKNQSIVYYRYRGRAEQPQEASLDDPMRPVGYELLSLHGTLWKHAIDQQRSKRTFSAFRLYDQFELADYFGTEPFRVGTALRGRKRGRSRARAPWDWKNNGIRGQWFFDPARNIAERHLPVGPFDLTYSANRYLVKSGTRPRRTPKPAALSPTSQ